MRYLHGLLQAWRAAQVELQGEYSIERLYKLQTYAKSTSYTRIALVLVLTALPSLAFAMLLECIPLRAPSDGLSQSLMFWVRTLLVAAESGFVVLQQCRYLLPKLPTSHTQILATSLLIGLCAACVTYGFASVVGYPLPFTLLWGSPVMVTLLAANAVIFWGGFLRENKTERQDLVNYFLVMGLQMTMIYVYPAYAYLYHRLAVAYRALAALLLPIIKLTMKNALGYVFRDKPDLRPDVVVFNVEVYQALFISWCLNGSTTKSAVISLMVTDFCEAVVALHDVSGLLARLTRSCRAQTVSKMRTASITGSTNNGTSLFPPTESIPHQQRIDILEFAVATLEGKRHARYNTRTKSGVASASKISKNAIVPLPESTASNGKYETLKLAPILPPSGLCTSATSSTAISPEISGRDRRFLHLALQLLHLTEFLLLIEFVELIIPTIYCSYLLVVYRLPNRAYQSDLRNLSEDELHTNLASMLVYSLLELISFLVLAYLLQRKMGMSALHQLAFVLESQWQLVQSKLLLWIVFSVQTPLEHYGVDFSFQFAWLEAANATIGGGTGH